MYLLRLENNRACTERAACLFSKKLIGMKIMTLKC